jgi:hypothetical protein
MVHVLKRLALLLAVGGALGDVVTMLLAPSFVTWFHSPGTGSALCNCTDVSRETATALIHAQLAGTAIGSLLLAVVGELAVRLWHARKEKTPPPPSSSSLPPPSPAQRIPTAAESLSSEAPTQG